MSEKKIPFQGHFETLMLEGSKTCTSRPRRMANPGDTFTAWGRTFSVEKVERMALQTVGLFYYAEEGFSKPMNFREEWTRLHPRKGWVPTQQVYVHFFKLVKDG